jgi:hypothetical protein
VRYSLFFNPYAVDDQRHELRAVPVRPRAGRDPCNGVLQPPGSNWCQQAGARGGTDGPNRSLMEQDYNNIAPRLGLAWDVFGDGRTAVRAGVGRFFLRERLSPLLNIAANPPFVTTVAGLRTLDSTSEPCDGCFGSSLGAPNRGREVDFRTPNSWQYNITVQREVWREQHGRSRVRRQLRPRPAEEPRAEPGAQRRLERQRDRRPPGVRDSRHRPMRRSGSLARSATST